MAFTPISNTVPQYEENGIAASGFFIKFYESGTTTPLAMATDSTGGTLLDKCELNTEGYPKNGSDAVFIPHVGQKYKIALFRNAADADSNNLANAVWPAVDNLEPVLTKGSGEALTIAALRMTEPTASGQQISLLGHTLAGIGGDVFFHDASDTTTPDDNGFTIVTPLEARWKRIKGNRLPHITDFGGIPDYNPLSKAGTDNAVALNALISGFSEVSFEGGGNYAVSSIISPNKKITIYGGQSNLYQTDITLNLIDLNGCSGSKFVRGGYSHNMDIADYNPATSANLFFATQSVSNISTDNINIFKTARQGFTLNAGGDSNIHISPTITETARDGIFHLDCTNSQVLSGYFKDTGDDAVAMAGNSDGSIVNDNIIINAGGYNIGGSGVRFNCSGVCSNNTITNADIFGIIAAVNSADATANADGFLAEGNNIKGIAQTGTVTAGIGVTVAGNVRLVNNNIEMINKEAHGYRIYGNATDSVIIQGGYINNALSTLYLRNDTAERIEVNNVHSVDCTDYILADSTGAVSDMKISNAISENTTNAQYLRFSSSFSGSVERLETSNNRHKTPNAVSFDFNSKVVTYHSSFNDEFATGVFADYSGESAVASLVMNGRYGDIITGNGSITFNATNSGLIAHGLTRTPLGGEIVLTPRTDLFSSSNYFINFIDSTNFRIAMDVTPGSNITFDWQIQSYSPRKVI